MVEQLSRAMGAALTAGDLDAARVAHEAIGKLLAAPTDRSAVVDMEAERRMNAPDPGPVMLGRRSRCVAPTSLSRRAYRG